MNWATQRKTIIEAILVACGVGIIALVLFVTLYKTPSCMDNKQNQGEEGVDCGGPCSYACTTDETPPSVRFIRAVTAQPGRTDAIAYIDNNNANAGVQDAAYTIEFYGPTEDLLAHRTGTITLPPASTVPLYVPDIYEGTEPVTQAFVTFDQTSLKWFRTTKKPIAPIIQANIPENGPAPHLDGLLSNPTAYPLDNVSVIATIFDASNNAIAASRTLVTEIPPQGSAPIIFTWNAPFSGIPARVEILPASPTSL